MAFIGNNPKWNTGTNRPASVRPSNPVEGMQYYDNGSGSFAEGLYLYNGAAWVKQTDGTITESEPVTVTGSWTTNTTYSAERRRVGDHYYYDVLVTLSGSPNATALTITLPSGDVIDTGKTTNPFANGTFLGASVGYVVNNAASGFGSVSWESTTEVRPRYHAISGGFTQQASFSNVAPNTFIAGDFIHVYFAVPIVGLTAS